MTKKKPVDTETTEAVIAESIAASEEAAVAPSDVPPAETAPEPVAEAVPPAPTHTPNPATLIRARDLYATYCASSDGKNFQGNPCPAWGDLPEAVRGHWYTVALRVGELAGKFGSLGNEPAIAPVDSIQHLADPDHAREVWRAYGT